jgi:creatinine amidohydrolase
MMLRLASELVRRHESVESVSFQHPFEPAVRGWIMKDYSSAGHTGEPRYATAEKGETIFTVFSENLVEFLRRVSHWKGSTSATRLEARDGYADTGEARGCGVPQKDRSLR